eukprot:TRINITY_DN32484_c0_g1_i1.p1 TRINITY_DN32484_c0_g1~~TRINITY_DN32484_c0_g1_i1.p1  ORF type:complete len:133 (+),score=0.34 TRINITY_DN32484_c0_g1_i1:298-696(+)
MPNDYSRHGDDVAGAGLGGRRAPTQLNPFAEAAPCLSKAWVGACGCFACASLSATVPRFDGKTPLPVFHPTSLSEPAHPLAIHLASHVPSLVPFVSRLLLHFFSMHPFGANKPTSAGKRDGSPTTQFFCVAS